MHPPKDEIAKTASSKISARRAAWAAALSLVASLVTGRPAAADEAFKVIVHGSNPITQMGREDTARMFRRQAPRWGHGPLVSPVDQSMRSPVREAFSKAVLKESVMAVDAFWRQAISAGKGLPPPVKVSDEDVIAYVQANEGAIGYVSAEAVLGDRVKTLKVTQ